MNILSGPKPRTRYFMRLILLLLALVLAPHQAALALEGSLYTGEAPVQDQGDGERRRALPLALSHVLQKISGLRNFDEHPLVEPALRRAPNMVLSYHYRNVELLLGDGGMLAETRLVARFSEREVDELARRLELPSWQPERAPLISWLLIDNGIERQVLPLEFAYVRGTMDDIALTRGLVLEWPEADADGNYPVDLQLIWGGYTDEIAADDGRGVMILAARREGPNWSVRANLAYNGENWTWRLQDVALEPVLAESVHQAVDNIAAANTISAADQGSWQHQLTIRGLRSAADYQRCLNYLQGLSTVNRVTVVAAAANRVTFDLELNAVPRYLEEAALRDGVLDPADQPGDYLLVHGANNER